MSSYLQREKDYFDHLTRIKTDFRYFFYHIVWDACSGNEFYPSRGFDLLCEYAQLFLDRDIFRLAVAIPPRNSKSLIFSQAMPLFKWLNDPSKKFIHVSNHSQVLEDFQTNRQKILGHPDYLKIFGAELISNNVKSIKNDRAGHLLMMPMLNIVLGLGGDYIISDDPMSAAQCSDAMAEKIWGKYTGTLMSRANNKKTDPVMIVSQRLADYDIVGRCVDIGYHYVSLQAIADEPTTIHFPMSGQVWERETGDVLNPDYEPLEVLERIRHDDEPNFLAQYQQTPAVQGSGVLNWEDIGFYDRPRDKYTEIILTVDSAATDKATSCPWGLAVLGAYTDERGLKCLDLLFADSRRADYLVGLSRIRALMEEWSPDRVVIENKSTGQALIPTLKLEHRSILAIDPKGSKQDRTLQSAVFFAQHRFRVPNVATLNHTIPWVTRFKYEFCAFPKGKTDDILDCITQVTNWYNNRKINVAAFYGVKMID
jgi:hypothetical protein